MRKPIIKGVRSGVDAGRLAAAVSRPGIDPRSWIRFARVVDVAFDEEQGMFADVITMPAGDELCCFVGSPYTGDDFGAFNAPKVGDVVVVGVVDGDPAAGCVILARIWNGAQKPPAELRSTTGSAPEDATLDPTIVVEPGRTLRVVCRDGAALKIELSGSSSLEVAAVDDATVTVKGEKAIVVDSPDVRLGNAPGSQVARIGDMVAVVTPALVANGFPVVPAPAPGVGITAVGQIISGAQSVKS